MHVPSSSVLYEAARAFRAHVFTYCQKIANAGVLAVLRCNQTRNHTILHLLNISRMACLSRADLILAAWKTVLQSKPDTRTEANVTQSPTARMRNMQDRRLRVSHAALCLRVPDR